jgi:integrase
VSPRSHGAGKPYKRADGLWCAAVDLPTMDGKRRRKTVASKDYNTVVKKLRELRAQVAAGHVPTTGNTTVEKWLEHWLETIQRPHVRPTTYRYYEGTVRLLIVPHIGARRLDRLTPEDVRGMHRAVQESSSRNAQKAQQVLQRALKDAEAEGLISRNVAAAVRKPKHAPEEKEALSLEVGAHILSTANKSRDALTSRWAVAFWTGARQGELLGLTWDHVDLETGEIELAWQLQSLGKIHGCGGTCGKQRPGFCPQAVWKVPPGFTYRECHKSLVWTKPKSKAGIRVVPILPAFTALLRAHKAQDGTNPHNLVWHHTDGRPYSPTDDAKAWKQLLETAGVEHVGVHAIRHSTATILQAAGVDEPTRMRLMGHSSAASQRGYVHVDQTQTRLALQNLNQLLP